MTVLARAIIGAGSDPLRTRSVPCHTTCEGPLDIIFLLERLESQLTARVRLPGGRIVVAADPVLELVDQLRVAIPEEVRAAKRINAEGERILEKAHEEASRIVSRAQEQAAFLIGERGLTDAAYAEGRRIIDEANQAGDDVRGGADAYAEQILVALESEAERALAGIRKGIEVLDARRAELHAMLGATDGQGPGHDDQGAIPGGDEADSQAEGAFAPTGEYEDAGRPSSHRR